MSEILKKSEMRSKYGGHIGEKGKTNLKCLKNVKMRNFTSNCENI